MKKHSFAAIHVGSYELSMKIFEITESEETKTSIGKEIREIDHVRHRLDLGTGTYATGRIDANHIRELERVLGDYRRIMKTYQVDRYRAYGTSALRETQNIAILLEQIEQSTGIHVDVLSNSEQRFLDYKSIALRDEEFRSNIEKSAAILDIGGGSVQLSMFDHDKLIATQNMKLGVLRMQKTLQNIGATTQQYPARIRELADSQIDIFRKMYQKDKRIRNLIIVDDYATLLMQQLHEPGRKKGYIKGEAFSELMSRVGRESLQEITERFGITPENVPLVYISGLLIGQISEALGADMLWAPGATLCDGMAYEYAQEKKYFIPQHDFEQDIVACARNISKRYEGSKERTETLQTIALSIFDSMKKYHGLGRRERLLLQISTILHDCGKYISLVNLGDCSFNIIMSTEIIGLSHRERTIVANVVRFNHVPFEFISDHPERYAELDHDEYLTVIKLTAILRVANALDRTHRNKFQNCKVRLADNRLVIQAGTKEDITVEKGLFQNRAMFFRDVFGIEVVIQQQR